MTYRVIQWATGGVGRAAIEGVLDHPDLELVGCWVSSAAKDGVDVGTLVGRDPVGVRATTDVDALLALDADCVIYSPLFADRTVMERILAAGLNVVTPLGWFLADTDDPLGRVATGAGVSLHGTGIHPGGITERFPLVLSALCGRITHVRAEELSSARLVYDQSAMPRTVDAGGRTGSKFLNALGTPARGPRLLSPSITPMRRSAHLVARRMSCSGTEERPRSFFDTPGAPRPGAAGPPGLSRPPHVVGRHDQIAATI